MKDSSTEKPRLVERTSIQLSKAMRARMLHLNTRVNAMDDIVKVAQGRLQAEHIALNDHLQYCRDELNAPEKDYEFTQIDKGFVMKKKG